MVSVEYLDYEILDDHGWDLDDEDLFEKAREADLDERDYGLIDVEEEQEILLAAEAEGFDWPFSCRDGICSNCAAVVIEGDVEMDGNQALTDEEIEEKDIRLTCIGSPASDTVQLVYNAKHLDYLQDRVIY